MKNGEMVRAFEEAFAAYVGAKYAIACSNGTVTLQCALIGAGIYPGQPVAVPPLTMASTSIAVLLAGGVPRFIDVDHESWLMQSTDAPLAIPVSLYGLHYPQGRLQGTYIDDAAQTLRPHNPHALFTSYSFQASKILSLGEGGMLVTDSEESAVRAREYGSLGYRMRADQARIDPAAIKSPTFERHHALGINARMNDLTATAGLKALKHADKLKAQRIEAAQMYDNVAMRSGACKTQLQASDGRQLAHDYWTFAIDCRTPQRATDLAKAVVKHGGEMPYPAWRLTYTEPAFTDLKPAHALPNAERLQPCLLQFQTNNLKSAEQNAKALKLALEEVG